jgi:hypothetical protein
MIRLVLLVALLVAAPEARADWEYTRWGMTPEQALTASNGQLKRCDPQYCRSQTTKLAQALLLGDYTSGEFNFVAFLLFDKRSTLLSQVTLKLKDLAKGSSLVGALRAKYGEPSDRRTTGVTDLWVWRGQEDQISYLGITGTSLIEAVVGYQPPGSE